MHAVRWLWVGAVAVAAGLAAAASGFAAGGGAEDLAGQVAKLQAENAALREANDRLRAENAEAQLAVAEARAALALAGAGALADGASHPPGLVASVQPDGYNGTLVTVHNGGEAPVAGARILLTLRAEVELPGVLAPGQEAVLRGPDLSAFRPAAAALARPVAAPPPALVAAEPPRLTREADGRTVVYGRLRSADRRVLRLERVYVAWRDRKGGRVLEVRAASFQYELQPGADVYFYAFTERQLPPPEQLVVTVYAAAHP